MTTPLSSGCLLLFCYPALIANAHNAADIVASTTRRIFIEMFQRTNFLSSLVISCLSLAALPSLRLA